jgi:hypothetical protein
VEGDRDCRRPLVYRTAIAPTCPAPLQLSPDGKSCELPVESGPNKSAALDTLTRIVLLLCLAFVLWIVYCLVRKYIRRPAHPPLAAGLQSPTLSMISGSSARSARSASTDDAIALVLDDNVADLDDFLSSTYYPSPHQVHFPTMEWLRRIDPLDSF